MGRSRAAVSGEPPPDSDAQPGQIKQAVDARTRHDDFAAAAVAVRRRVLVDDEW